MSKYLAMALYSVTAPFIVGGLLWVFDSSMFAPVAFGGMVGCLICTFVLEPLRSFR